MKKFTLFTILFVLTTFTVMAEAITYNDPEKIIERLQRDMKHK